MRFNGASFGVRKAVEFFGSIALLAGGLATARGQSTLDGFDPNANGTVRAVVVQPDGKILIGGDFTTLAPNGGAAVTRNRIARLNPDGTLDTAFAPNANGTVFTIALQPDGQILVGGDFTSIGGQMRSRIARLGTANGSADAFNPNASNTVNTIALQNDGKILVGGAFFGANSIGGQARNFIARLDPTTGQADSFNPSPDELVWIIKMQADGRVLVGGSFSSIGGQFRNFIARLDANTGLADSFNPNPTADVLSICLEANGKILIGGLFQTIGLVARNRIARLDPANGALDPSFNPNANNAVLSIAVDNGKILVGGTFSGSNSMGTATRNFIARLDPSTGRADSFNPNANGFVYSVALQPDGRILMAGGFTSFAPDGGAVVNRNRVARTAPPPGPCSGSTIFAENFDGGSTLPAGWVATNSVGGPPQWAISTSSSNTAPNNAFVANDSETSEKLLTTPTIAIGNGGAAHLSFRNNYDFEYDPPPAEALWDGGVLDVSVNGGAFFDITDPVIGGSFISGGYTGRIDNSANNPLGGQMAWGGSSGGYISSIVNLGPHVIGQTIVLRFRMGTDGAIGHPGWRVDTISIILCSTSTPTPTPTPTPGATPTPTPSSTPGPTSTPGTLGNISTRLRVQSGDNTLIGGLIATGTTGKRVIIRAIGPSLTPFGVPGALANPTLDLYQGNTLLFSNDDWQDSAQQAEIASSGLAPSNTAESAIIWPLTPGQNYTAVVRGKDGAVGIGVVDAFDLDQAAASKLGNISTRGFVDVDDNVMIAGLIAGPSNGTSLKVLVRALGPTLTDFGVAGALANPTLDLVNSSGTVIRSNNNWTDDPQQRALIEAAGLAPAHDEEAVLVETVAPGAYTAIVRGNGRTTGVGLVEVYNIP